MLEMQEAGWRRWKKNHSSKFEKTIAFALLSQVEGLVLIVALSSILFCDGILSAQVKISYPPSLSLSSS